MEEIASCKTDGQKSPASCIVPIWGLSQPHTMPSGVAQGAATPLSLDSMICFCSVAPKVVPIRVRCSPCDSRLPGDW